jgi:hypothetical protein
VKHRVLEESSGSSARGFKQPAYSFSRKGEISVLIMNETLRKNNLNPVVTQLKANFKAEPKLLGWGRVKF